MLSQRSTFLIVGAATLAFALTGCQDEQTRTVSVAPGTSSTGGSTGTTGGSTGTTGGSTGTTGGSTGTTGGSTGTTGGSTGTTGGSTGTTGGSTGIEAVEINIATLTVRSGPGTSNAVVGTVHSGEVYATFETNGGWQRIWFDQGAGWVSGTYTKSSSKAIKVVTAARLNVRSGPGTQHGEVGQTIKDSLRVVASTQGSWRRVGFGGQLAWVHGSYLGDVTSATLAATRAAANAVQNGTGLPSAGSTGTSPTPTPTPAPSSAITSIEINAGTLNVRRGPGTSNTIINASHQGEHYATFESSGDWQRIWFDNGSAWVHGGYTKASSKPVKVVTAAMLNVRSGAGTQYGRIGEIPRDSLRSVISTTGSWSKVSYSGGTGYVHNSYLTDPTSGTLAATKTAAARAVNGTSGPGGSTTPSGTVTTGNPSGLPISSRGFLQLPASAPGLYSYTVPSRRWGRDYFIYGILRVGQDWSTTGRPRMGTGDISFANGGPISGHVSHQKGVDIDVRPVCGNERSCTRFSSDYSRTGTRTLIGLFRQHTPIKLILFNDTAISGVTTWPNHDNHFHARAHER